MKLVKAAVVIVAAAAAILLLGRLPATYLGAGTQPEQGTYVYPSPSYWPLSPFPKGSPHLASSAPSVSPCPSWAPTLVQHPDGTFECKANIPPNPRTGPECVAPDGHTYPPIREPDGTYDCG